MRISPLTLFAIITRIVAHVKRESCQADAVFVLGQNFKLL